LGDSQECDHDTNQDHGDSFGLLAHHFPALSVSHLDTSACCCRQPVAGGNLSHAFLRGFFGFCSFEQRHDVSGPAPPIMWLGNLPVTHSLAQELP